MVPFATAHGEHVVDTHVSYSRHSHSSTLHSKHSVSTPRQHIHGPVTAFHGPVKDARQTLPDQPVAINEPRPPPFPPSSPSSSPAAQSSFCELQAGLRGEGALGRPNGRGGARAEP